MLSNLQAKMPFAVSKPVVSEEKFLEALNDKNYTFLKGFISNLCRLAKPFSYYRYLYAECYRMAKKHDNGSWFFERLDKDKAEFSTVITDMGPQDFSAGLLEPPRRKLSFGEPSEDAHGDLAQAIRDMDLGRLLVVLKSFKEKYSDFYYQNLTSILSKDNAKWVFEKIQTKKLSNVFSDLLSDYINLLLESMSKGKLPRHMLDSPDEEQEAVDEMIFCRVTTLFKSYRSLRKSTLVSFIKHYEPNLFFEFLKFLELLPRSEAIDIANFLKQAEEIGNENIKEDIRCYREDLISQFCDAFLSLRHPETAFRVVDIKGRWKLLGFFPEQRAKKICDWVYRSSKGEGFHCFFQLLTCPDHMDLAKEIALALLSERNSVMVLLDKAIKRDPSWDLFNTVVGCWVGKIRVFDYEGIEYDLARVDSIQIKPEVSLSTPLSFRDQREQPRSRISMRAPNDNDSALFYPIKDSPPRKKRKTYKQDYMPYQNGTVRRLSF